MAVMKLPNLAATFVFTMIGVLLVVGLLFWLVSHG
jgi:hypothetical protein